MSYVHFESLPRADPVNGFAIHTPKYIFGVQVMDIAKDLPADQTCAITLLPLRDLDKVGALVWAYKNPPSSSGSSGSEEKKEVQWRFVCLPEEHSGLPGAQGRLHLFDYDSIKGFMESEKEFTKCPMCKRGSPDKAKVDQNDVAFIEDLLAQREDFRKNSPDAEMALFYEVQIVKQVVLADDEKHRATVIDFVRHWHTGIVLHSLEQTIEICYQKDSASWLKDFVMARAELSTPSQLLTSLEQACRHEASSIVVFLISEMKPQVSRQCFEYLIGHRNEYLIDQLLDYYVKWTSREGGATQDQILRGDDWLTLGRFACLKKEFPHFVRAVQLKNIYRLLDKIRTDDQIGPSLLEELGLREAEPLSQQEDGWEWGANSPGDEWPAEEEGVMDTGND